MKNRISRTAAALLALCCLLSTAALAAETLPTLLPLDTTLLPLDVTLDPGDLSEPISTTTTGTAPAIPANVPEFTAVVDGRPVPGISNVAQFYTYTDWEGKTVGCPLYVVTVPADAAEVELTFPAPRLAYNYTAEGAFLTGYYEDATAGALTCTVPVDAVPTYLEVESGTSDGVFDVVQVQNVYNPDWTGGELLYAVTFRKTADLLFGDVARHWGRKAIVSAVAAGMMDGADGLFSPNAEVTRADVVTALWNHVGCPYVNYFMQYTDVDSEQPAAEAIRWATALKLVNGVGGGRFDPERPVTRQELTTILYRYAKLEGKGFTGSWMFLLRYPDAAEVSSWANEGMHWCVMKGIITGKSGKLAPKATATRAELATVLTRFFAPQA